MITGGTEAGISQLGLAGFCSMRALSTYDGDPTKASRPFDKNRDGFVPAEGSGTLILEELNHALNRNATIYGEIIGFGVSSDAFHPVQPEQNGLQAANAMSLALGQANLLPKDIDYINAHGTSTPLNDMIETKARKVGCSLEIVHHTGKTLNLGPDGVPTWRGSYDMATRLDKTICLLPCHSSLDGYVTFQVLEGKSRRG